MVCGQNEGTDDPRLDAMAATGNPKLLKEAITREGGVEAVDEGYDAVV